MDIEITPHRKFRNLHIVRINKLWHLELNKDRLDRAN